MDASTVDSNSTAALSNRPCGELARSGLLAQADFQTVDRLRELDRINLKIIYRDLAAPAIADVHAEYGSVMLSQGDRFCTCIVRKLFSCKGPWIGKGFCPIDRERGQGYNVFGTPDSRKVLLPMDTYIGGSNVVNGAAYILDYRKRNRGAVCWLRGELRVLSENLLLGMGTFGPWNPRWAKLRRTIPFLLYRTGPAEPQT